jgi:UDP-N-acetylmuramoyl-tripeptide--D-alanyl-D-alanine ligase
MIALTLADVAALAGGVLGSRGDPTTVVRGPVVADSRRVVDGALFVAVAGEHVDGHDFAVKAVADGAVAVLAARPIDAPAVVVDDTVLALGRLARGYLGRLDPTVVGITGSSGKTSTKDLLAQVLGRFAPTVAPEGSFNTEVGVPLTVLRADADTRFLVLEMSARGVGHIAYLCGIAPPRIGVVLNVGVAHLGEFGSRETIARAKGELVEALPADGGVAVLNADDPLVSAMRSRTKARVVTFGLGPDADVRAGDVRLDELARPRFRLSTPHGELDVRLALHGAHQVANAAAVAAVALELGMPPDRLAAALRDARPVSKWRMEVRSRPDGATVVNDAYNANPDSMRAALAALVAMAGQAGARRRAFAVLGVMAELGPHSEAAHVEVGRAAAASGLDRLVVVGEAAAGIAQGAVAGGLPAAAVTVVADAEQAVALLRGQVQGDDVVLVKASRSADLQRVAQALLVDDRLGGDVASVDAGAGA